MLPLRTKLLQQRSQLSPDDVRLASCQVSQQVLALLETLSPQHCAVYFASGNEINLQVAINELEFRQCQLFAPKHQADGDSPYSLAPWGGPHSTQLVSGKFGIQEPVSPTLPLDQLRDLIEVWLVPGLGFSKSGARIGFGHGFYDRLLHQTPGLKIGIGYDWQLINQLPQHPWDVPMDYIATPTSMIRCR